MKKKKTTRETQSRFGQKGAQEMKSLIKMYLPLANNESIYLERIKVMMLLGNEEEQWCADVSNTRHSFEAAVHSCSLRGVKRAALVWRGHS